MSLVGTTVAHYRIEELLGRGGMGDVYIAWDETLQRRVALKSIRSEHRLRPEVRTRFLREARVLSRIKHPDICQIYDYIRWEDHDFLVLELISGRTLKLALGEGLDDTTKMEVMLRLVKVLVAAHEEGIVHRDLKPDNVMLDDDGGVKILDFGLSRSLTPMQEPSETSDVPLSGEPVSDRDSRHSDESFEIGATIGEGSDAAIENGATVAGIGDGSAEAIEDGLTRAGTGDSSGEQIEDGLTRMGAGYDSAEASGDDLSGPHPTRIGTILGTLGYMSPEQARGEPATPASDMYSVGLMLQEIFTEQPPYPPGLSPARQLAAARKGRTRPVTGVDPELAGLIQRLKSRSPDLRPSAVDTQQQLESIQDRPRRRRRRLLAVLAIVFLAVVALVMTLQAFRIAREAERANREAERANQEAERANHEAEAAAQVSRFLIDLFRVSDPEEARGRTITARELLVRGAEKIDTELEDQPLHQARMQRVIGAVHQKLGLYDEAAPLLEQALATRQRLLPADHPEVADSLWHLGGLYQHRGEYQRAEALLLQALQIYRQLRQEMPGELAAVLNNLGTICEHEGRFEEAEVYFVESLELREELLPDDLVELAEGLNSLGGFYRKLGRYEEAGQLWERALEIREHLLGDNHPDLAGSLYNLGNLYMALDRHDQARDHLQRALKMWETALGPDHPTVSLALNSLGRLHNVLEEFDRAEPYFRRALAIKETALGPDHPSLTFPLVGLGDLLVATERYDEARATYRRALGVFEAAFGADHPDSGWALAGLAEVARATGQNVEAERLYRKTLEMTETHYGTDYPLYAQAADGYAKLLRAIGREEEAREWQARVPVDDEETAESSG